VVSDSSLDNAEVPPAGIWSVDKNGKYYLDARKKEVGEVDSISGQGDSSAPQLSGGIF
jgi:hypothetical protein